MINPRPLLQWALETMPPEDYDKPAARKRALVEELNRFLGTAYAVPHLNSWLAGRKPLPVRAWQHLAAEYIEQELFEQGDLAERMIALLGLRDRTG
ncbi:hypothetical protein KYK30_31255 [Shinella yambaruensis]|uniref:Uncharacterized protein n=1 Tax=Shinella yambaruensis TaxID=415996 RepID=A0ABQ5ZWX8_9HYPH|nr:hypothetical protein [Shinella yambaruensis]MCJ8029958.1 hypothetical protein [Shinella yambaruensis]MCU7984201.1 hypothetical protein [Shinella yambaruensis]GLR55207.1 hypothetical protein GCM10007923_64290 [Shinella yambaruensis]